MNLAAINGVCKERIIFKTFLVVVKACMSMMKMIICLLFSEPEQPVWQKPQLAHRSNVSPLQYWGMLCSLSIERNWSLYERLGLYYSELKMSLQYKAMHWKSQLLIKCIFFLFPSALCMCPSERIQFFYFPIWHEQTFNFNLISE